jgi:glycosyltransferase involved in cell wall biosynthesis
VSHIVMLLSNAFRPDPRVLKEANSLAAAGYQVTIICWDRSAELVAEETLHSGVRVARIHNVPSAYGIGIGQLTRLPRFWLALVPLIRRVKPDLIHCHDFDTLPIGLLWGKLHRTPVIYDAHEYYADLCKPRLHGWVGELLYRMIRCAELWGARHSSAVVTVDETLGDIYRKLNHRVLIIGHYPSVSLVDQAAPVFSRDRLNLLYIGRISRDRGMLVYLELLQALIERGVPARLHLAGVFTPQSEMDAFNQKTVGLENSVIQHGWTTYDQLPQLLLQADVGLSILLPEPRYVAGLPVKLFEYMAAGLPVIASNFPSITRVINAENCGLLVDPLGDPGAIADTLLHWWQHPSFPAALGANGRIAILDHYNWEQLASKLDQLNQSVLNQ